MTPRGMLAAMSHDDGPRPRRSRFLLAALVVMALAGLAGCRRTESVSESPALWRPPLRISASPTTPPPSPSAGPTIVTSLHTAYPRSGPGTYRYATGTGPVLGTAGPIRRFRIAIESNIKAPATTLDELTAKINATLGDPRGWVASGQFRLRQVPATSSYQFTVYLVTSRTSSALCAPLYTAGYTSCRQGGRVVLNLDRWMSSVPEYTGVHVALDSYRTYMINHEVGHALGHNHELCPGKGKLAPVMEQQTLGLHGCEPNIWPYVNGKRYDGPPGHY